MIAGLALASATLWPLQPRLSLSLGPIAVPVAPLLLMSAVWLASWTATRPWAGGRRHAGPRDEAGAARHAVLGAAGIGLLAARLAYLASNAGPYLASPASMLDVRDGGWHTIAGVAAAAAWLLWKGWRVPGCRRPLALATASGLVAWSAGTLLWGVRSGGLLPATSLTTLAPGRQVDLPAAAAGRPVVVHLWASWCGPCRQEMPTLAAAQQRESTVGFLFVNEGESEAAARSYLGTLRAPPHDVLLDPGSQLGAAVGSRGLPTTLFYDAQGRLIHAHFGVLNPAALESRLRALRPAP
jgi:thiol-disulfide isomerase/thioredoxin